VVSRNALAHSKGAKSDTIHRCTVPAPFDQGHLQWRDRWLAFLRSCSPSSCPLSRPLAGAQSIRPATCKDYENGSHQDMVDIVAAVHQALKADPNFGSLSQSELDSAIDKVCIPHLGAKVIDALGVKK
jgi:hypothetical protein